MLVLIKKRLKGKYLIWQICCLLTFGMNNAFGDAPYYTDDTEILKPRSFQAIIYGFGQKWHQLSYLQAPALEFDYGFYPDFEVDTYTPILTNANALPNLQPYFPNETGLSDFSFELKYRFMHESTYLPSLSFGPNFYLPIGNAHRGLGNGRLWYYIPISAEKNFDKWSTYAELAYAVNSAPFNKNYVFAGWVLQKTISEKLMLGGELYTQTASSIANPGYTLLNLGGYLNLSPRSQLIASLGHNLFGPERWSLYLGIGWS